MDRFVGECPFEKGQLFLIAGPCVIEDEPSLLTLGQQLRELTRRVGIPWLFKNSYDKANRTSVTSYRGPGLEKGLAILDSVKKAIPVPYLVDFHEPQQAEVVAQVADILQVPAFLCRQTDMLLAAGHTGRIVNIKKGQFLPPTDMKYSVGKVETTGNRRILLTERGFTFGYGNLVSDMRALPRLRSIGYPVVFDATHSVQKPGAAGGASGGERDMVSTLARAAVAAGCDGLFLEVHEDPDHAPSDGPNMLRIEDLEPLLQVCLKLHAAVRAQT